MSDLPNQMRQLSIASSKMMRRVRVVRTNPLCLECYPAFEAGRRKAAIAPKGEWFGVVQDKSEAMKAQTDNEEVHHARQSGAGRRISGCRASKPRRGANEAVESHGRVPNDCGFLTWLLLTEGCPPVGELCDPIATGVGGQLLPACGRVD